MQKWEYMTVSVVPKGYANKLIVDRKNDESTAIQKASGGGPDYGSCPPLENFLYKYGDAGWELVSLTLYRDGFVGVFKRPK